MFSRLTSNIMRLGPSVFLFLGVPVCHMSNWTYVLGSTSLCSPAQEVPFAFRLTVSFKTSRSLEPLREHKDILRNLSAYADKAKIEKAQMYMQVVFFSELLNIKEIKHLCVYRMKQN